MSPRTRRQTLRGAAALLAAFAGCSGTSSDRSNDEPHYPENVELDPETYSLRNPGGGPVVRRRSESTTEGENGDDGGESPSFRGYWFVASSEDAKDLVYADVAGADEARRFVAATDFDEETIFVQQRSVGECYRLELCYVGWSGTEIWTEFGRRYRDADVACEVGAESAVAILVRIPDVIDPERNHGFGFGVRSGGCHVRPELRRRANRNATSATTTTTSIDAGQGGTR